MNVIRDDICFEAILLRENLEENIPSFRKVFNLIRDALTKISFSSIHHEYQESNIYSTESFSRFKRKHLLKVKVKSKPFRDIISTKVLNEREICFQSCISQLLEVTKITLTC